MNANSSRKKRFLTPALPHLDVYLSMLKNAAVLAAVDIGLFKALKKRASLRSLAATLKTPEIGLERLLEVLVTAGYAHKKGRLYGPTGFTRTWLGDAAHVDYTPALAWMSEAWRMLEDLPRILRRGRPSPTLWKRMRSSPEMGRKFSLYMLAYARHCLPDILESIRFPQNARRLLDIGGSHGLYSVALCRKYPDLHATIFDFPDSLRETPALIRKHRLASRIRTVAGNALTGDWGRDYDAVLFFSLIHNHTREENAFLFRKIFKALKPGGRLFIYDYLSDQKTPDYNASFNLTLFLEVGTRIFSSREIRSWLSRSGFVRCRRVDLNPREKGSLLIAEKPA